MTPKQERFIAEYMVDLNATQAAIRAGYSPKTANEQGARLLAKASVSAEVARLKAEQLDDVGLTARRVLEEIRRLSFANPAALFDEDGQLRKLHELPEDVQAAIASVEVVRRNIAGGDGHTDDIHKVKLWDKVRSLEMLAKHFALLVERQEHSGDVTFRWSDE